MGYAHQWGGINIWNVWLNHSSIGASCLDRRPIASNLHSIRGKKIKAQLIRNPSKQAQIARLAPETKPQNRLGVREVNIVQKLIARYLAQHRYRMTLINRVARYAPASMRYMY